MNHQPSVVSALRCPVTQHAAGHNVGCGSANVSMVHGLLGLAQCNACGHWFRKDPAAAAYPEEIISTLSDLVAPGNSGLVLSGDLHGDAVRALMGEVLDSWADALREGSKDKLIADFDRIVGQIQLMRDCCAAVLPTQNVGTDALPRYLPAAELSEIKDSLDGLTQPITPESVDNHYPTRALYMAEIALGERRPYPVE
ncbi:hypothetical protein [Paraburkholderia youngii]|uniref:hypothetical protein n=1 Tax=Paraburkholderia youngii TaxID=2782701 RepID=UPI003D1BE8A3